MGRSSGGGACVGVVGARGGGREGATDDRRGAAAGEVEGLGSQVKCAGGASGGRRVDRVGAGGGVGCPGGVVEVVVSESWNGLRARAVEVDRAAGDGVPQRRTRRE